MANEPFTNHFIDLQKGDLLNTFSDGYSDQFGGPKGKKFMIKNLKQLLSDNLHKPMDKQKQVLEDTLNEWMANIPSRLMIFWLSELKCNCR